MRSKGSLFLFAALLLWFVRPVEAQPSPGETPPGMDAVELVDPLDGQRFRIFVPLSANGLGGFDSDGCNYSKGRQPRTFEIVTSPTTLFSATLGDWKLGVPEESKQQLAEMLIGLGQDVDDVRQLGPADRYELAAAVARQLNRGPFAVGELYLQGAWSVRDTIVGFLPNVQGASDAWSKFVETLPMVKEVDNDRGKTIALFDMARLAHRGGFVHERDDMLALVDTLPDAGMGATEKRDEFRRRVAAESRLLEKARAAFVEGLETRVGKAEDRAWYRFLVGDLSRRLGELDRAKDELTAVELDTAAAEQTRSYARDVLAVLKVQSGKSSVDRVPASP